MKADLDTERQLDDDQEIYEVEYLVIGQVVAPRGVRGELKVRIESDIPERFLYLDTVYLGEELQPFIVERARLHKGFGLLQLEGINDRDEAETWRQAYVHVHIEDAVPLAEGEYYVFEIEGLDVYSDEDEYLGHVAEVIATGANEVYVVAGPQGELLLPAIEDVILSVDLDQGTLTVHLPEGLR